MDRDDFSSSLGVQLHQCTDRQRQQHVVQNQKGFTVTFVIPYLGLRVDILRVAHGRPLPCRLRNVNRDYEATRAEHLQHPLCSRHELELQKLEPDPRCAMCLAPEHTPRNHVCERCEGKLFAPVPRK
jgi:hypothetical protein